MNSVMSEIRPVTAARSGSGTTTTYWPVAADIMIKAVYVLGINPAAADGDTVRVVVDYSAENAASYTTVADTTADEYNDTDDLALLGNIASNGKMRSVGASDWGTLSNGGTRVAGGSFLRIREIWTGTVTDGQIQIVVYYVHLNDTFDG